MLSWFLYPNTNRCSCRYGTLYCTDRDCNTTNTNTNCTRCRSARVNKVCGPNGRTYINSCTAIHCAGVASVDLIDGPCPRTVSLIRAVKGMLLVTQNNPIAKLIVIEMPFLSLVIRIHVSDFHVRLAMSA